jgi:hypothetical protein
LPDIAGAVGAGADRAESLFDRTEHGRVLAHAEIAFEHHTVTSVSMR